MVRAHWVVGGNRPIDERPVRVVGVDVGQLAKRGAILPELQQLSLLGRESTLVGTSLNDIQPP